MPQCRKGRNIKGPFELTQPVPLLVNIDNVKKKLCSGSENFLFENRGSEIRMVRAQILLEHNCGRVFLACTRYINNYSFWYLFKKGAVLL
jgi:hypothetical protein